MKPMVENSTLYKDMILHIMETLTALNNAKSEFTDPIKYSDTLHLIILNNTSCLDEYRIQPTYFIFKKYIASLAMVDEYKFDNGNKTIGFYTDMRYSFKDDKYDRVSYGVTISVLKDSILITPYLDIMYMNLRSKLALLATKIDIEDKHDYNFYKIYSTIYNMTDKSILEEYPDVYENINNIDENSEYFVKEIAILTTLVYMKYVVPADEHVKFMELEGENTNLCNTSVDTAKAMYEINKSLYEIGSRDPKLLDDIVSKIRDLIDKVGK